MPTLEGSKRGTHSQVRHVPRSGRYHAWYLHIVMAENGLGVPFFIKRFRSFRKNSRRITFPATFVAMATAAAILGMVTKSASKGAFSTWTRCWFSPQDHVHMAEQINAFGHREMRVSLTRHFAALRPSNHAMV